MTQPVWVVGDDVRITATVTDANGTLITPTSISVTAKAPDGSTCTVSSPNPTATGLYEAYIAKTSVLLPGAYQVEWTVTASSKTKSVIYEVSVDGPGLFPPFASADDVAAGWRPLTASELTVVPWQLEYASALLRARFPDIDGQVTSGAINSRILALVTAGMVKRALIGGTDGISQTSETLPGGFSRGQSFANPLGNVFLSAADLTLILGYQPAGGSFNFANTTTRCGGVGDGVTLIYDTLIVIGP